VQKLLGAIETSTHTGLRDRTLLGVLAYTFARIGAVVNLKVEDYHPSGKRFLLRFKEKGGKEKELPVHHKLEELLDEYLKATGLGAEPGAPLLPASIGKNQQVGASEMADNTIEVSLKLASNCDVLTVTKERNSGAEDMDFPTRGPPGGNKRRTCQRPKRQLKTSSPVNTLNKMIPF
jgi:integrase